MAFPLLLTEAGYSFEACRIASVTANGSVVYGQYVLSPTDARIFVDVLRSGYYSPSVTYYYHECKKSRIPTKVR